jgi:phosphohistidine phosphatase
MAASAKHLYVLRHAKSSWEHPELPDHDRPLATRGRKAAKLIAQHLHSDGIEPQLVLCSTARRAQETLERVDPAGERMIESELYDTSAGDLIERLRRVPEDVGSVMVIGHNPTLQRLVLALAGPHEVVQDKFPTAALATLAFHGSWEELQAGCATLTSLVRPKDLR